MELDIRIRDRDIDVARIERALLDADPAGVLDVDPATGHLRLSTCASHGEVMLLLHASGHPVPAEDIIIVPSVCCGGCSG